MSRLLYLLIAQACIWSVSLANLGWDDDQDYFIYPGRTGENAEYVTNVVMTMGSKVNLRWVTQHTAYQMNLWQQSAINSSATLGDAIFLKNPARPGISEFSWVVQTYGFNLEDSPIFFIGLVNGTSNLFGCHYFNITRATPSPSSASGQANATLAALPSSTTDATLSIGTKVGLGLGVGIGLPILALLGLLLFRGRRQSNANEHIGNIQHGSGWYLQPENMSHYQTSVQPPPLHEVSGHDKQPMMRDPVEIGGNEY